MSALSPAPVSSPSLTPPSLTPPPLTSLVPSSSVPSNLPPEQSLTAANPPSATPPPPTVDTSPPHAAPPPAIPSPPPPIPVSAPPPKVASLPPSVPSSLPPDSSPPPPLISSSPPPDSSPPQPVSPSPPSSVFSPPPTVDVPPSAPLSPPVSASPPKNSPPQSPPPTKSHSSPKLSPPPPIPSPPPEPPNSSPPPPPISSSPPAPPISSPPPPRLPSSPPSSPVSPPPTVPSSSPPPPPANTTQPVSPSPPSSVFSPPPPTFDVPPSAPLSPPVSASPPKNSPPESPPPPKSHSSPKLSPPTTKPRSPPPQIHPPSTSPSPNSSIPGIPAPATTNITVPSSIDTPVSPNSTESNSRSSSIRTGSVLGIGLGVGLVFLSVIGLLVWFIRKQKRRASGFHGNYVIPSSTTSSQISDSNSVKSSFPLLGTGSGSGSIGGSLRMPDPNGLGNSKSWFSYEELLEITNGFSSQNLLGEGGFGCVYKGCLPDGRQVAVKQLKVGGGQGEREFRAEVEIISRVHHRHLVSLVGYCTSERQRLLVYDYVPNNTLYYHLHGDGRPVMDWSTRVRVAVGAARGIAYLHEDCHPRIIHRDIKSSNILLDNSFEAQVSDFGLAKLALDANTHVTTRVMGTFGYMAPEYASSGKLTERSDVFSFGVVLLELISGRKPVDSAQPVGDESLVEWARPLLSNALDNGDIENLVDPRLENNYIGSEMSRMIEAAAACVRHSSSKRPRMGQVVRAIEFGDSSDLRNGVVPGQSTMFDSAEHSMVLRRFQMMAFTS